MPILALVMALFFVWGSARAQEVTAPDQPSAWWMRGWEGEAPIADLAALQSSAAPVEAPKSGQSGDPVSWTKLVFQSYRAGNWDIWVSLGNGSDAHPITFHPASDVRPRFSREAHKVVFASNRDGNWEIYSINVDGTELARLTNNGGTDTMPDWSPDGSRIVFSSDRTGKSEIFTMNADGSGVVQMTTQPKDHITPSWSKDNRIA